jgi:hypothetical protein
MAQTQLNEMEDEDKIDFDSFSKSQSEVEKYAAGMARIISCSVITNRDNLPSAYLDNYNHFKFERYLKLKAEKRDSIITVIIPIEGDNSTGDLDYCYDWTGADSIDYLAGKRIPVKNINEDIFRVEKFNKSIYRFMPLSMIKKLMKKNIIKEEIYGKWSMNYLYKIFFYSIYLTPIIGITYAIYANTDSSPIFLVLLPYALLKSIDYIYAR